MRIKVYLIIVVVLTFSFSVYAQDLNIQRIEISDTKFKGKLTTEQFIKFKNFLETTSGFKLVDSNSFIINYKQPSSDCFYNQYEKRESSGIDWFEKNIYKNVIFEPLTLNLFYQAKAVSDKKSKMKFDLENFIYNSFMKKNELCYALLMVNSVGEYRLLIGEYSSNEVTTFLEELKIN